MACLDYTDIVCSILRAMPIEEKRSEVMRGPVLQIWSSNRANILYRRASLPPEQYVCHFIHLCGLCMSKYRSRSWSSLNSLEYQL